MSSEITAEHPVVETVFEEFVGIVDYHQQNSLPTNEDPYTQSMQHRFALRLKTDPETQTFFKEVIDVVPGVTASSLVRRTENVFQHIGQRLNPDHFPAGMDTSEAWDDIIRGVVHDNDMQELFYGNIVFPIMTNQSVRGIMAKMALLLHGKTEGNTIVDLGCSRNTVVTRLMHENDDPLFQFPAVDVMRRPYPGHGEPIIDSSATERLNRFMLENAVSFDLAIGVDPAPFHESEPLRALSRNHTFRMGELVQSHLVEQFDKLTAIEDPKILFLDLDATTMDTDRFGSKADVVYASTMMWEGDPEINKKVLDVTERLVATDGLILVQDFIRKFPQNGNIKFYKRWPQYTYSLWVKDMAADRSAFEKYFSIYSGRIQKIIPQPALGKLATARQLGLPPVKD